MSNPTGSYALGYGASTDGPVTCAACGCRLTAGRDGREAWFHFHGIGDRDARGCRVPCAELAHDRHGRAEAAAA
jgi:hypothetical protein